MDWKDQTWNWSFPKKIAASKGKDENICEWVTRVLEEKVFIPCINLFVSGNKTALVIRTSAGKSIARSIFAGARTGNPETLSMHATLSKVTELKIILMVFQRINIEPFLWWIG